MSWHQCKLVCANWLSVAVNHAALGASCDLQTVWNVPQYNISVNLTAAGGVRGSMVELQRSGREMTSL